MTEPSRAPEPSIVISHDPPHVPHLVPPRPPKEPFKWSRYAPFAVFVLVVAAAVGGLYALAIYGASATNRSQQTDNSQTESVPRFEVRKSQLGNQARYPTPDYYVSDVDALVAEFEENEVRAEDKYKNKVIQLYGTLSGIESHSFGGPSLTLYTTNRRRRARASMTEQMKTKCAALTKGQTVTVQCTGAQKLFASVGLDECVLR